MYDAVIVFTSCHPLVGRISPSRSPVLSFVLTSVADTDISFAGTLTDGSPLVTDVLFPFLIPNFPWKIAIYFVVGRPLPIRLTFYHRARNRVAFLLSRLNYSLSAGAGDTRDQLLGIHLELTPLTPQRDVYRTPYFEESKRNDGPRRGERL